MSMILSGQRPITADHARCLAERFNVDAGLFLEPAASNCVAAAGPKFVEEIAHQGWPVSRAAVVGPGRDGIGNALKHDAEARSYFASKIEVSRSAVR